LRAKRSLFGIDGKKTEECHFFEKALSALDQVDNDGRKDYFVILANGFGQNRQLDYWGDIFSEPENANLGYSWAIEKVGKDLQSKRVDIPKEIYNDVVKKAEKISKLRMKDLELRAEDYILSDPQELGLFKRHLNIFDVWKKSIKLMGGKPYESKTNRVHKMIKKYVTKDVRGGGNSGRNTMGERANTGSRSEVIERGDSDVGHDQRHPGVSQSRRVYNKHSRESGYGSNYGSDSGRNAMGERFNSGLRRGVNERDSDADDRRHHTGLPLRGKENQKGSVNRKYIERRTQRVQIHRGSDSGPNPMGERTNTGSRSEVIERGDSDVGHDQRHSGVSQSRRMYNERSRKSDSGSDYGSISRGNKKIKTSRRSGSVIGGQNSGINRSPKRTNIGSSRVRTKKRKSHN
jgi:hypothetical protein